MPLLTVESVIAVYERGVINPETMAKYMMNALNASPNDIDESRLKQMDGLFIQKAETEAQQLESNVAATNVTAKQQQAKDAESGQGVSKKMRIELERTAKVGGGNAK